MTDQFVKMLTRHLKSPQVLKRMEICSEWSIVEHWFRMEIYLWIRQELEGLECPLVEGPYYTRLPTRPSKAKFWNEWPKWCDLVALAPDGVYWLELKAIWYRTRTWKNNLYSALRDLLSLAGMDVQLTAELWKDPSRNAPSHKTFLPLYAREVANGPHHRYSICLLQAVPDSLLEEGSEKDLRVISSRYLGRYEKKLKDTNPSRFSWHVEEDRVLAVEACRIALGATPEVFGIGTTDRGERFPEESAQGKLAIVTWRVPE